MALKLAQKTLSPGRLEEVARCCELQGRPEAAAAFRARARRMIRVGLQRVDFNSLTLKEQEVVEWEESYGNRQS
jgi:hypothetical protein